MEDNYKSKFDFEIWSYYNKFNFKSNKNKLISEDKLNDYVFFTNNCVESFNNLLNVLPYSKELLHPHCAKSGGCNNYV